MLGRAWLPLSHTQEMSVFSKRSAFDRQPNAMARAVERARARGQKLIDLTVSNPTTAGLPYEEDRILAALRAPAALRYEPASFGLDAARDAVATELGRDGVELARERILLTASTSEAYAFAFQLLCDPGDAVLVPAPSYPLLEHLAALSSVRLVPYRLAYDGAWHLDLDSLRRAAVPGVRAVFVVSPNNPTGSYLKRNELHAIAELGLPVVSDEVFARYPLTEDPQRIRSALDGQGTLVLALGGLSKLAALPQLKLGWMLLGGPEHAVDEALGRLELIADSYLSVAAPVQHALPELFAATRSTVEAIRVRTRENLARIRAELSESPVSVLHVEGGWYAVLRLPQVKSEEAWGTELVEQAGVLVQPGWFFDFPGEPYAVVSLLTPSDQLGVGVRRLGEHCTSVLRL
ncbi:MAG: pyridoxal phosphate-dependent aminotransferase [Polyangiaceae bacterium]|nr:pyridoxal phosphate-dependent aminotransferase [Polyangiaceae bacterium]MCE7894180.1 pyridoxal phosphate-dependent aminotransferase [Sorangiineae bacterium PRO1]MCL4754933.1 pyridoxal phosphate-dependent aminotransferase [Myxococcales bacterium]